MKKYILLLIVPFLSFGQDCSDANTPCSINDNICLIKTDAEGNTEFTNIIESDTANKSLLKKIDILGRDTNQKGFNIEIYDDGSIEKKYVIE